MTTPCFGKVGVSAYTDLFNEKLHEITQLLSSAFFDLILFKISSLPPFKIYNGFMLRYLIIKGAI